MNLVIGCPAWKRDWIIHQWFRYAELAAVTVQAEPAYVVVLDTHDTATEQALRDDCDKAGRDLHVCHVGEDQNQNRPDERDWSNDRIHHMVWLRNVLLDAVRALEPDLFLSLDSDILIAERALLLLCEDLEHFDAVASKVHLAHQGTAIPNYAMLINADAPMRRDEDVLFEVDAIMALKLMTPAAYAVNYDFHWLGEDVGWSKAVRHKGMHLGWDGRVCSKHVMRREQLAVPDLRCGY